MQNTTTRRGLLKAGPAAAACAALPTIAISAPASGADDQIEQAWRQRQAAYAEYNALPIEKWGQPGGYTPEETRLWAAIDEAEEVIRSTVAKTPRGAEIQLWVALYHSVSGREDDEAITRGDLAQLSQNEDRFEWNARLALAALRSLNAMGA